MRNPIGSGGWNRIREVIRPALLQRGMCSDIQHRQDLVPELDDEANHRERDYHRHYGNNQSKEAGHEFNNAIENRTDGPV